MEELIINKAVNKNNGKEIIKQASSIQNYNHLRFLRCWCYDHYSIVVVCF